MEECIGLISPTLQMSDGKRKEKKKNAWPFGHG
jgi:hypothetical protein